VTSRLPASPHGEFFDDAAKGISKIIDAIALIRQRLDVQANPPPATMRKNSMHGIFQASPRRAGKRRSANSLPPWRRDMQQADLKAIRDRAWHSLSPDVASSAGMTLQQLAVCRRRLSPRR